MPGFDGTGPRSLGPMSGRGLGRCVVPGQYVRPRFWGFGGFGHGWRNRYFASGIPGRFWGRWFSRYEPDFSAKEKVEMLQSEADYFEQELKNIREEIDNLKKSDSKELK